jgi:hypothetical protein
VPRAVPATLVHLQSRALAATKAAEKKAADRARLIQFNPQRPEFYEARNFSPKKAVELAAAKKAEGDGHAKRCNPQCHVYYRGFSLEVAMQMADAKCQENRARAAATKADREALPC